MERVNLSQGCPLPVCYCAGRGHTRLPDPRRQTRPYRLADQSGANPWTDLQFRNDPDAFQFAIVTDRTGGHRAGVFPDGVRKADLLQPEFVMSVGDLIQGYTEDEAELDRQWDEFAGFVENLSMPFFHVPGNHDINNEVMARMSPPVSSLT